MRKLLVLFMLAAFFLSGSPAQAGKVGYPMQFCTGPSGNPTTCSWVTGTNPLPVTLSATSQGAVAAMSETMALATLGQAVRAGIFRYNTTGWEAVSATKPMPISGDNDPNSQNNRIFVMAGYCYPDFNPASSNYAACTGADQTVTLPDATSWYSITVLGATAVMTTGQAASLTGEGVPVPEGVPLGPIKIPVTDLRIICSSAAGRIWVVKCQSL